VEKVDRATNRLEVHDEFMVKQFGLGVNGDRCQRAFLLQAAFG